MNVTSARIDIKAAAGRAERALERSAEPLAAIHGTAWPERLLELAWRRVVDNSAHDSICGCSQDAVVNQVLTRFAEAEQIGQGIVTAAIRPLAAAAPRGSVVVVNPSPFDRTDVVELDLDVPAAWEAVDLALPDGERVATQLVDRPETVLRRLRMTRTPGARALRPTSPRARAVRALPRWSPDPARCRHPGADAPDGRPGGARRLRRRHDPRRRGRGDGRGPRRGLGRGRRPGRPAPAGRGGPRAAPGSDGRPTGGGAGRRSRAGGPRGGRRSIPRQRPRPGRGRRGRDVRRSRAAGRGSPGLAGSSTAATTATRTTTARPRPTASSRPRRSSLSSRSSAVRSAAASTSSRATTGRSGWPPTAGPAPRSPSPSRSRRGSSSARASRSSGWRSRSRTRPAITASASTSRCRRRPTTSSAEGQFAVVDRGLTAEAGHGEVPTPTFPAHGFVHAAGVTDPARARHRVRARRRRESLR